MTSDLRLFHLGDILSITTGRLVSPRRMDGVYDILNYLTGDNLFTHQLPRAADESKPFLTEQYPQFSEEAMSDAIAELFASLEEIDSGLDDGTAEECVDRWLAQQVAKYGEEFPVQPVPAEAHEFRNPIEEACDMMGDADKVYVVSTELASAGENPNPN